MEWDTIEEALESFVVATHTTVQASGECCVSTISTQIHYINLVAGIEYSVLHGWCIKRTVYFLQIHVLTHSSWPFHLLLQLSDTEQPEPLCSSTYTCIILS